MPPGRDTAVHRQDRAGDPVRRIRGQEQDRFGDVPRLTVSTEGMEGVETRQRFFNLFIAHERAVDRGFHDRRRNCIDPDLVVGEFDGEVLDQLVDAGVGR